MTISSSTALVTQNHWGRLIVSVYTHRTEEPNYHKTIGWHKSSWANNHKYNNEFALCLCQVPAYAQQPRTGVGGDVRSKCEMNYTRTTHGHRPPVCATTKNPFSPQTKNKQLYANPVLFLFLFFSKWYHCRPLTRNNPVARPLFSTRIHYHNFQSVGAM